jgi:hypothetical protein
MSLVSVEERAVRPRSTLSSQLAASRKGNLGIVKKVAGAGFIPASQHLRK